MKFLVPLSQGMVERGLVPDLALRFAMRQLLAQKIKSEKEEGVEFGQARLMKLIHHMHGAPVALNPGAANEQHYELPAEFFELCLGSHLKYSSAYYRTGGETLNQAEADMLAITCERAALQDGQHILEFGCGWGSLSLFMAERYPKAAITAVSNSRTQKAFIDAQANRRGLKNLTVITSDMNVFTIHHHFDRIVSVEMFEHMRNWEKLLAKAASFLKTDGKMFIHIFAHREHAYLYDHTDESDFIGKYFFTGGIMPSDHLLLYFQEHLTCEEHWRVSGTHYARTAEHWLQNMDANKEKILPVLKSAYGEEEYRKWWNFWRVFFMACAELWGYKNGTEWMVSHYRLKKK